MFCMIASTANPVPTSGCKSWAALLPFSTMILKKSSFGPVVFTGADVAKLPYNDPRSVSMLNTCCALPWVLVKYAILISYI